jgi:hypothetical protein
MNNQELELKIQEILAIENFFDMMEAVVVFEKEYKTTSFYKKTRMPLVEVIKNSKMWYLTQTTGIAAKIQGIIDEISFDNIQEVLMTLGNVYEQENKDTIDIIKEFKGIIG